MKDFNIKRYYDRAKTMMLPTAFFAIMFGCQKIHGQVLPTLSDMIERSIGDREADIISQQYIEQKFPTKKSSCLKNALSPFLRVCVINGVEAVHPGLRVKTAVYLSLCEFELSGLKTIPEECITELAEGIDLQKCVQALQTSPQWWTTYSGNYQSLSQICYENSLPYEKEQILDLFLNITELYSHYQSGVEDQWSAFSESLLEKSTNDLDRLSKIFESRLNSIVEAADEHDSILKDRYNEIHDYMRTNISTLKTFVERNNEAVSHDILTLRQKFSHFFGELSKNYQKVLREQQDQLLQADDMMETLNDKLFSKQYELTKQMDLFFDEIQSSSLASVSASKDYMDAILVDNFNILREFQDTIQHSIIFALKDDLIPQINSLSSCILENLTLLNSSLKNHFDHMVSEIGSSHEELDRRSNNSLTILLQMESHINDLNNSISISLNSMKRLLSFLGILMKSPSIISWLICLLSLIFIPLKAYRYPVAMFTAAFAGSKFGASLYRQLFSHT